MVFATFNTINGKRSGRVIQAHSKSIIVQLCSFKRNKITRMHQIIPEKVITRHLEKHRVKIYDEKVIPIN